MVKNEHFWSFAQNLKVIHIFSGENVNRQKSISFRLVLLLKPYDQPVGRGRQKTQGRFDQKKFFFRLFYAEAT